jgi:hypothetical protein
MDKDRIDAIAARGEQIKTISTEFLWVCRGIKPPLGCRISRSLANSVRLLEAQLSRLKDPGTN